MSGRVRLAGAVLGLVGMTGASALAAVTTLHVALEHGHSHHHEASGPTDHHPHQAATHGHEAGAPNAGQVREAETPEHAHALVLVANVERHSGRSGVALAGIGHAFETPAAMLETPSRAPARVSRDGPPARAAPLARRSVILQV